MLDTDRQLTPSWSLVKPSFELVRKNSEAIIFIILLPALLTDLGAILITSKSNIGVVVIAIGVLWRLINLPISYYMQLRIAQDQPASVQEYYAKGMPFWLRLVGFMILFYFIVFVGLILLIIPGLILIRRYYFTPYYLVDKKMTIQEAMKASQEQTAPVSGWVWGTLGVMMVFAMIAALLSNIRYVGPILAALIGLIYFFGPVLRWQEVSRSGGKKTKSRRRKS